MPWATTVPPQCSAHSPSCASTACACVLGCGRSSGSSNAGKELLVIVVHEQRTQDVAQSRRATATTVHHALKVRIHGGSPPRREVGEGSTDARPRYGQRWVAPRCAMHTQRTVQAVLRSRHSTSVSLARKHAAAFDTGGGSCVPQHHVPMAIAESKFARPAKKKKKRVRDPGRRAHAGWIVCLGTYGGGL